MYQTILFGLAFLALIVGSITDMKKREVPDWVNYGLMLTALSLRGIFSIYLLNYFIIINGLVGFGLMFLLACIMFYSGQWGGGDAKLLMALGAIFGISLSFEFQTIYTFLINLILIGSLYGLAWTMYLFFKNWSNTKKEFKKVLLTKRAMGLRIPLYLLSILFFVGAYFIIELRGPFILFGFFMPLMFYVWAYTKVVENVAMLKHISPTKLTEGDWIAEDIVYKGKIIVGPKDLGINKKQIEILNQLHQRGKMNTVLIKEGIPFVPSFLFAFIATLILENWILVLL